MFLPPIQLTTSPNMMASRFPHASHSSNIPSMLPSVAAACFWLVVVFWFADWQPINATMYCIFIIFALLHSTSQTMGQCFSTPSTPRATSPDSLPPPMLTLGWLLCFPFMFQPLKAKTMPIALFLMGSLLAFQTKEPAVARPNQTTGA